MKSYLSDLMKYRTLTSNHINLIEAHCGCGKTTWFFDVLLPSYQNKHKIVYLVDTNMLEDSMIGKYGDKMKIYDTRWRLEEVQTAFFSDSRVVCMNYKKFGILIKKYPYLMDNIDLIVCDEVHNLTKYIHLKKMQVKNVLSVADRDEIEKVMDIADELTHLLKALMDYANEGKTKVVMLTATPFYIRKVYWDKFRYRLNTVVRLNELEGYTYKNKIEYISIKNVLNKIDTTLAKNERTIIYIPHIDKINKYVRLLKDKGYNAIGLWSLNNTKHSMSDEQIRVRNFIIEKEQIPSQYQIVIFNEAYTTGWNLKDETVKYCYCNSMIKEVQIQFRGRIRHNIKTLFIPMETIDNSIKIKLDRKWLYRPLTAVLKDELCAELNIIDKCNR